MPDPELEVESDFQAEGGTKAALVVLDRPDPPTAVFAFNDLIAIGVMRAARLRGVRIPEELSVVGFDDTFEASIVTPALTTVRQPLAEMGRMAVNLLLRQLQNQRIEALQVQLETKLIVRESTAPALSPGPEYAMTR
jgi:LacI family transcriptional regulator